MANETFVSYWLGEEGAPCPTLDRMPARVDVVALGFVLIDDGYGLDFDELLCKVYEPSLVQEWVKGVRAGGAKVLLSINDRKLGSVPDVRAFVGEVVSAAVDWGVDGIDFDYEGWLEPSDTMIDVVTATRPALADALGREPYLSAPVYDKWAPYPDFLRTLAAQLDLVTTMDYTPYLGLDITTDLFGQYAEAIGSPEKLAIGVSCMGPPDSGNFTPLGDVEKLCRWEPSGGKKAGAMRYSFSYDVRSRPGSGTGEPDGAFTKTVDASLR